VRHCEVCSVQCPYIESCVGMPSYWKCLIKMDVPADQELTHSLFSTWFLETFKKSVSTERDTFISNSPCMHERLNPRISCRWDEKWSGNNDDTCYLQSLYFILGSTVSILFYLTLNTTFWVGSTFILHLQMQIKKSDLKKVEKEKKTFPRSQKRGRGGAWTQIFLSPMSFLPTDYTDVKEISHSGFP
jgi:hypothetical protein